MEIKLTNGSRLVVIRGVLGPSLEVTVVLVRNCKTEGASSLKLDDDNNGKLNDFAVRSVGHEAADFLGMADRNALNHSIRMIAADYWAKNK